MNSDLINALIAAATSLCLLYTSEEHRVYGYIRGNKCLKRLSDFICDIPGFYFGEYGPACRIIFN